MRFASEAEAVIVRALASADLLRDAVVIPGTADADQWVVPITDFVASIPVRLREELADRMPPTDPSYPDAYALALSAASDLLRQQLRVRAERFRGEAATPATPVRRASL